MVTPWMLHDPEYVERILLRVPEVHNAYYEGQKLVESLPEGSAARRKAELVLLRVQLVHKEAGELIAEFRPELEAAAEKERTKYGPKAPATSEEPP